MVTTSTLVITRTPATALTAASGDGLIVYGVAANTTPQWRTYDTGTNAFGSAAGTVVGSTGVTFKMRTSPTKQEAIAGYVNSTGTLQIMCYNGTSWTNDWSVSVGGTGTTRRFDIAYETNSGDVMVLYSRGVPNATGAELGYQTKPGSSDCNTGWSGATTLNPARTSGTVTWVKMAWDRRSTSDLITAIWSDDAATNADLSAMVWSGSGWVNEPGSALETSLENVAAVQDVDDFDVEYESLSGDVMVVWANSAGANGTNGLRYATCTGGTSGCTWSAATNPAPASADDATNLDLSANPTNDELVLGMLGDAGDDLWAGYWSATSWSFAANLDATAATTAAAGRRLVSTGWLIAGPYARSVIVYYDGDGTTTNVSWYSGSRGTFTAGTDFTPSPVPGAQQWLDIDVDPRNRDRLMLTDGDASSDVSAKRLVMSSTATFTWTNADAGTALEANLSQATAGAFSFAYWRNLPTYTQSAYRWYTNADGVQPSSAFANASSSGNLPNTSTIARLRAQLSIAQSGLNASSQSFGLQYGTSTSGPWTDVASSVPWCNTSSPVTCNTSWTYRKKITFDNSSSSTSLTNFPVLISLTTSNFTFANARSDGFDVVFTDGSGTALNFERQTYNGSSTGLFWVNVPSLPNSAAGNIWMYYGNAAASSDPVTATVKNNTWDSNYKGVWHLEEDPTVTCSTTKEVCDSTSSGYHGDSNNMEAGDQATGILGGALAFDGTNEYVDLGKQANMYSASSQTLSCWVKTSATATGYAFSNVDASGSYSPGTLWQNASGSPDFTLQSSAQAADTPGTTKMSIGTWYLMTGVWSGSNTATLYVNGVQEGTPAVNASAVPTYANSGNYAIGRAGSYNGVYFPGSVDECRFSTASRSADWTLTEYKSVMGTLASFGSEQNQAPVWRYANNATPADGATISSSLLTGSDVAGSYAESNPTAVNPNAIAMGQDGEWDFALDPTGTTLSTTYYFRIVKSDGTALSTYSVYPQLFVGPPYFTQSAYRWYANADSVTPGAALASANTATSLSSTATVARLRTQLAVSNADLWASGQQFKLQYGTSAAGPWGDVASSAAWCNTASPLCNASWGARRKITFDNSASSTNLTNFSVLVSLTSSNIDYGKTQNAGQDIRFTDFDGTALNYEIEKWDESGTSLVWVKVPQIDAASTTDSILMYYDNASASDAQSASNTFDSSTKMIQHLEETAACATTFTDSTSNANDGSCSGTPTSATGKIGDARSFNGTNQYVSVPDSASLSPTGAITVSAWVNQSAATANKTIVGKWVTGGTAGPFVLRVSPTASRLRVHIASGTGDTGINFGDTPVSSFTTGWHHVAFTYDSTGGTNATRLKVYIDGVSQTLSFTGTIPASLLDTANALQIGLFEGTGQQFNGTIDQVNVDSIARSADWIKAQYLTGLATTFQSYGGEEAPIGWKYKDNATPTDGATLDSTLLTGSDVAGSYAEGNPTAANPNAISSGQEGEWDFALDPANAVANTTYYFRLVKADGTALTAYTYYPQISVDSTLDQAAYRWFANDNSTDVGAPLAARDTRAVAPAQGTAVRLRAAVDVSGVAMASGVPAVKLQVATRSGACDAAFSGETYVDVSPSSGTIRFYNNASPADGATATANASDPTYSGHTKRMQSYEEQNNAAPVTATATGELAVWDFALVDNSASGGSVFCFRIVKSDGTPLNTYTVVPELSINAAPSSPTALAQTKNDSPTYTGLATGGWNNATSTRFTATAADPDSSDYTYLCAEAQPLGTNFYSDTAHETCGGGVIQGSTASVVLTLSNGAEYHWQVRTMDGAGLYSPWVSYDTNLESVRDVGINTTPPTGGTVYDGLSIGIDLSLNDGSLSSLSANWSGVSANVSGLSKYEYSIGTTAGGTNVKSWTDNGTATSVTATGLNLRTNQLYYFNVRTTDAAGNVSSVISSNGQTVAPTLTFSVARAEVNLLNISAMSFFTDVESVALTTSTNGYGGYVIRSAVTGLAHSAGSRVIPLFNGGSYAAPDSWQAGDIGLGYTSSDADVQGVNKFQAATCPGGSLFQAPGCYAPFSNGGAGDIVADHTANVTGAPIVGEAFTFTYRVTTNALQPAGRYTTNVVFSNTVSY